MSNAAHNFGFFVGAHAEKQAAPALMKYLMRLAPEARMAAVKRLPPALRETASYKLLGRQAADAARHLGPDVAHGAPHVFNVTRNAQRLAADMPRAVQQRSTLGALLHDVARHSEIDQAHRVLKANPSMGTTTAVLEARPDLMHSELGARYTKQFLRRNRQLAQNVSGLDRAGQRELRTAIRAHDTDAWSRIPYLQPPPGAPKGYSHVLATSPTARNVYVADKLDALGQRGFDRTVSMGQQLGSTPQQTMDFVMQKNIPKYHNIINNYAPQSMQPKLHQELGEYEGLFSRWGRQQGLSSQRPVIAQPPFAPSPNPAGQFQPPPNWGPERGLPMPPKSVPMTPNMPKPMTPQPPAVPPASAKVAAAAAFTRMHKQAIVTVPTAAGIGAGLGAITAPSGHRMEGLGRGAVKGTGTGAGMIGGSVAGGLGALVLGALNPRIGKTLFGPSSKQVAEALKRYIARGGRTITRKGKKIPVRTGTGLEIMPYDEAYGRNAIVRGGIAGAIPGAGLGYAGASSTIGKPTWEKKEASLLSADEEVKESAARVLAQLQKNAE